MIKKFTFFIFLLLAVYLKPFYIVSFVFFLEYIWILIYFTDIFRNLNSYYRIDVKEVAVCDLGALETWLEYSKLIAFKRVYYILTKKKINLRIILKSFCFFILGVPKRFLDLLIYFLYKNKASFKEGLDVLYYHSYYELKYAKIEVLNGEITLNCNDLGKILIRVLNKHNSEKIVNLILSLQSASRDFSNYELKNKEYVKMISGGIITKEGSTVKIPHYLYEENGHIMHATSNIDIKLDNSQFSDVSMGSLIKKGAKNPGTIFSEDAKISFFTKNHKFIPTFEMSALKFNHLEIFNLDTERYKYIYNKDLIYRNLLLSYLNYVDDTLVKELVANYYTNALDCLTLEDILNGIDDHRNNFLI